MDGYLEKILKRIDAGLPLNEKQQKFIDGYNSLKNISMHIGEYKSDQFILMEIVSIDQEKQTAVVKTTKSGVEKVKTLHWCRKHLVPIKQ